MKKMLAGLTMAGIYCLAPTAYSEVKVTKIVVNQVQPTPESTNIRVDMFNTSRVGEKIDTVELQARATGSDDWKTVKVWTRPMRVEGRQRLALDFLPGADGSLDPILTNAHFEVRALVNYGNETKVSAIKSYDALEAAGR
jgi:hypothetical protein